MKHKWNFVPKKLRPKPHPVDYFVPNFGEDPEISDTKDSEVQAMTQIWSDRLSGQIGKDKAAAQISKDAEEYRAAAEKAQREADAAAAKAAAAEADAKEAQERAVSNDFKDMMKANLLRSQQEEQARVESWAAKDKETQEHFAATQVARERDHDFYEAETRSRQQAAYAADKATSEELLAKAAADDAAKAAKKAHDAAEAAADERHRINVEAETQRFMEEQRIAGMREGAREANIDLEKERQRQLEAKRAEEAAKAAFWAAYEKEHGIRRQKLEAEEAAQAEVAAKAEQAKQQKEAEEKAERQAEEEKAAKE